MRRLYQQEPATLFYVGGDDWQKNENSHCPLCGGAENVTTKVYMVTSIQADMSGQFPKVETVLRFAHLHSCPDCQTLYPEGTLPEEAMAGEPWKFPDQIRANWEQRMNQGS